MATATASTDAPGDDRNESADSAGSPLDAPIEPVRLDLPGTTDQVARFRPAILGVRAAATAISVFLAAPAINDQDWVVVAWCAVVVAYNIFRLVKPVRYVEDSASLVRLLVEVGLHLTAVVATGYWESPLVFGLITAIMVAGFARGFGFALRLGVATAAAVSLPVVLDPDVTSDEVRLAVQWTGELILVGLIAGYARRVMGEADRQHTLALDRLGRLADANLLLHSLHRVAQTLPASLDIEEVLDTTMGRLRDLFDHAGATILLHDETAQVWAVSRWDGPRPSPTYKFSELPDGLRAAHAEGRPVIVNRLTPDQPGVSVEMASGLYAPLPSRNAVVGLVALEHHDMHHFAERDRELLEGFVEPAGLAIDNAQWFGRLRTVGADEERTRIARDLHDRIGQSLAYLAFELDRIVKLDEKGESVTTQLGRLRTDVRGVIGEVRDTLYDLRTDVTDENDFVATMTSFLDRIDARTDLEVRMDAQGSARLPLVQEREMWRIAQEAVTNVERHAQASRVVVTWRCDGSKAVLIVADDGVGFPEGKAGRLDSYGIIGMRERASSVGATLDISSEPKVGTMVRCELRLD